MDEDNPIDEISRIEARLEELAEVSERCRKIILVSKTAIAGGVALLLVMMLGLFGSNQVAAIGSIAVVLDGIVSLGSNISTLQHSGWLLFSLPCGDNRRWFKRIKHMPIQFIQGKIPFLDPKT